VLTEIRVGDEISIVKNITLPFIPYKILDRFKWLVLQIPEGKVISYKQIIDTLGLWDSVYRALPTFIKSMDQHVPTHRIANTQAEILGRQVKKNL